MGRRRSKTITEAVREETTSDLTIKDNKGNVLAEYSPQLIDTIKSTVAKEASDEELYMFLQVASMYDLNPFMKEIWFTKMKGQVSIMTSRDGYLKLAKRDANFVKCQSMTVHENDEFEMELQMGEVTSVTHKFKQSDRGKLLGAYAILKMRIGEPMIAYVDFREYDQRNSVWKKYPSAMIRKVAENDVLKRFAGITGIQSVEDMPQGFVVDADENDLASFDVIDTNVVE